MVSSEETVLFQELVRCGCKGVWLPRAKVRHFIGRDRLTREYLKSYYRGYGQTVIRMKSEAVTGGPRIFGCPTMDCPVFD